MNRLPISKGWVALILGPLSGLWIIAQHPDEVTTIVGATYSIITAVAALHHDLVEKEIKAKYTPPVVQTVSEPTVQ